MSVMSDLRASASVLIERFQFLRQAGITFKGARDLYEILGYERILTIKEYRDRYARGGIAKRVVEAFPNATWRGELTVSEQRDPTDSNPTKFDQAWKDLARKFNLISILRRADILSQLGYYSVILIGAPGKFEDELPKSKSLAYFTPFAGGGGPGARAGGFNSRDVGAGSSAAFGDATIQDFDTSAQSRRFGQPNNYLLRRIDATNPDLQKPVHWSRCLHLAEGCLDNEVYGQPCLESVWNLLDDLEKVTGGGAEAFWLRANAGLHLNVDKDMTLAKDPEERKSQMKKLREQAEDYKHQLVRMIQTRGVDIQQLGSQVADFSSPADAIITQIAGTKGIPKRILMGSEMGQLASSEDRDNWRDQVNGRQTQYAGPYIVRRLVDRLMEYGYLPTPKGGADAYDVRWPHMQTLTETEKADGANKWADINKAFGTTVFTDTEIRDHWYQKGPLDEVDPVDNLTEDQKAAGAFRWAMANKSMGVTIFTDDEIRDYWYGLDPLSPDEKVPIGAPERVSLTEPVPAGADALDLPDYDQPTAAEIKAMRSELDRVLVARKRSKITV